MQNREYLFNRLERIEGKTRQINHMISTNQHPRNIKKMTDSINDLVDDIRTQIERSPIAGRELNQRS
jgi:DNA-binding FrmR family transcriptional regulator